MSELSTTTTPRGLPVARRVVLSVVAAVATGVLAGLVWLWLARPAEWEARDGGIVLTEAASRGQFAVVVVFVLIGAVTSVVAGWLLVRVLPDLGWLVAPVVMLLTVVAALVAWQVGVFLGPPPPGSVSGVSIGDRIPDELAIDGIAPFFVWPIFGLAGVLSATWAGDRGRRDVAA